MKMGFFCASRSWVLSYSRTKQDKGASITGWGQGFGPDHQLCRGTSISIANGACKNHHIGDRAKDKLIPRETGVSPEQTLGSSPIPPTRSQDCELHPSSTSSTKLSSGLPGCVYLPASWPGLLLVHEKTSPSTVALNTLSCSRAPWQSQHFSTPRGKGDPEGVLHEAQSSQENLKETIHSHPDLLHEQTGPSALQ